jgi:dTMP kinase
MGEGRFVVLEGGEASGKTTQARLLAARLRDAGREVVETFEPGGTALGAHIRSVLLEGDREIDTLSETLLLAADRAQHVVEVVRPALARGLDVVSDRYVPSTLAYQGVAGGLGVEQADALTRWATGGLAPTAVVVLDVSEEVAEDRRQQARDRFERAGSAFHRTVRQAYRDLASTHDWVVVNGSGTVDAVAERVWAAVGATQWLRGRG